MIHTTWGYSGSPWRHRRDVFNREAENDIGEAEIFGSEKVRKHVALRRSFVIYVVFVGRLKSLVAEVVLVFQVVSSSGLRQEDIISMDISFI